MNCSAEKTLTAPGISCPGKRHVAKLSLRDVR
jgi:hypothetical protein